MNGLNMKLNLVVLAGGKGERLWPLSTSDQPKQFFKFFEKSSLFQNTLQRNKSLFDQIFVLSHEKFFFTLLDQLGELGFSSKLFLEPLNKGTLPSLILALLGMDSDDAFFMTPSDLKIGPEEIYRQFILDMVQLNVDQDIYLLGKKPKEPSSAFGYIQHENGKVQKFIEKPNLDHAQKLLEKGDVLWNCGMIFAKVSTFLKLVQQVDPDYLKQCQKIFSHLKVHQQFDDLFRFDIEAYGQLDSKTIDYGLLEKANNLQVLNAKFDWQDLGSFNSIIEIKSQGQKLVLFNSSNIRAQGNSKEIIVQNLSDIAIIEKEERIFILKR